MLTLTSIDELLSMRVIMIPARYMQGSNVYINQKTIKLGSASRLWSESLAPAKLTIIVLVISGVGCQRTSTAVPGVL